MQSDKKKDASIPDLYDTCPVRKLPDLPGSMTVEASLVMPVVLLALAAMISFSWKIHDIVLENSTVNEAVELSGHLMDADNERIERYAGERLLATLRNEAGTVTIEKYRDGSRAVLHTAGGSRRLDDGGFRPEKVMRAITLTEVLEK